MFLRDIFKLLLRYYMVNRLCGAVVRVLGQRSGFDSRRYQIVLEVLGLERGPWPVKEIALLFFLY
jgi:hypothetical protein